MTQRLMGKYESALIVLSKSSLPTVWTTKFASGDLLPRHIPKSNWKQSKAIESNQKQSIAINAHFWMLSIAFDCFQLLLIAFDCFRSHPQEGGLRTQTWWFRLYMQWLSSSAIQHSIYKKVHLYDISFHSLSCSDASRSSIAAFLIEW